MCCGQAYEVPDQCGLAEMYRVQEFDVPYLWGLHVGCGVLAGDEPDLCALSAVCRVQENYAPYQCELAVVFCVQASDSPDR